MSATDDWGDGWNTGREQAIRDCIEKVNSYIDETHKHIGNSICLPFNGDRCDITAALRVAVNRLKAML